MKLRTTVLLAMLGVLGSSAGALAIPLSKGPDAAIKSARNLEREYRPYRLGATLFTTFGLLALVVAVMGIYSTITYDVRQRTHEFGVRVALGAGMATLVRQVVGEGIRTVSVGVLAGVAAAVAGGKLIAALLYGTAPGNPVVLAAVALVLLLVAALAAALPAWRAARTDPLVALKQD